MKRNKTVQLSHLNMRSDCAGATSSMGLDESLRESNMNMHGLKEVKARLQNTKMFLNMVIHDLRNPTVSLKMGSIQAIAMLNLITSITERQKEFAETFTELLTKA